jgi:hypothetical protein
MTDNEKKSFIMYKSFRTMLLRMSMEERGKIITAIYEYLYDGEITVEMGAVVDMAFCAIKDTLDRDAETYAEKCRINSENGKKGGRPRKSSAERSEAFAHADFSSPKTERFFEKAKKADNDNNNDNGNENENENVNGNGDDNGNDNEPSQGEENAVSDLPHRTVQEEETTLKGREALSEKDRRELADEGVPDYYIEGRLERAAYFAAKQKKPIRAVLSEWWRDDLGRGGTPRESTRGRPPTGSSFDTDEFFAAAMRRSADEVDDELF